MTEQRLLGLWIVVCLTTVGLWAVFSADLRRQLDRAQAIQQQTIEVNKTIEAVMAPLESLNQKIAEYEDTLLRFNGQLTEVFKMTNAVKFETERLLTLATEAKGFQVRLAQRLDGLESQYAHDVTARDSAPLSQ